MDFGLKKASVTPFEPLEKKWGFVALISMALSQEAMAKMCRCVLDSLAADIQKPA
ncbi:MAG: hypothetical protein KME26_16260 [Oscillatoria princeps RMCB-10]|jgi:hypothetical protein|nr:hypothetical protein [Oscillatoria princeps RMCB-10]